MQTYGVNTVFTEDEYLLLSGIQHYAFCKRQWGLIHIELQWSENLRTVEGRLVHERAHDAAIVERRGDLITSRAMPVSSRALGISGECDVVEFRREERESDRSVFIPAYGGIYSVVPVEYKRGAPKSDDIDALQLCAQAMCLEEMLSCRIPSGYIFYAETRRRQPVDFTDRLRTDVEETVVGMHDYFRRGLTPRSKRTKACNACSLRDLCLPALEKKRDAGGYIDGAINGGDVEE